MQQYVALGEMLYMMLCLELLRNALKYLEE